MSKSFISPFTKDYWRYSALEFRSVRMLVFAALIMSLRIVLGMFIVPIDDNLRMLFKFIPDCIGSMLYGPLMGMCVGGLGDLLGYFIFPTGAFFPGYTISAILTNLIFALFLYRQEISYLRLFLSRLTTNVLINVGLGSLWSYILYGKGFFYYAAKSIAKNLILLPVETVILIALISLMLPVLNRLSLIPHQDSLRKI